MTRPARPFPAIEELVPHRGIMLWLQRVTAGDESGIEAQAEVPAAAWYLDEHGRMPAWMGIELMAQAIAAHAGLRGWLTGRPPCPGLLLGTRAYRADAAGVPAGARLLVSARPAYADEGGFAAYDCAIHLAGRAFASASLKVFEPADFEAFLKSTQT